ncbi:uncharacterized protein N7515_006557 [Penicillium bovifimosum]|uniref:Gfd2/YDR514C-like C-terminal domain-containing protein n=1 Tax=Penicillium bovifimosum TaxID=126998 RepID=A0A9W9KZV4_9EURO|nr:uncharacterized protein N7515_006557 [Penicillium bovifimosum]KAJ5130518.1 hypothetical protein N7515_006557 [Penicillium bovifimosum]
MEMDGVLPVDPVAGLLADEPQANVKDPDVDCSHEPRKTHLECPSADQDKHDGAHSDKISEGQLTAVPTSFTPATIMARFYLKYVPESASDEVNAKFYEGEKFWNRGWDLYHLPVPREIFPGPLLLIPTLQAQGLLDEINSALDLQLTLTGQGKEGLVIEFNETMVQPTFLGRCSTPEQKQRYEGKVSGCGWGLETVADEALEDQIKQSAAAINLVRKKKKINHAHEARRKQWEEGLGRVQAHFGLRPPLQPGHEQPSFANGQIGPVDVLSVTKWDFHDAPIFISIDLEWKETSMDVLTEVGISTLDMMDLQGVPPGVGGETWIKQIRSRHLRVSEYRDWVNHKYSHGCPDRFGFGESEMIPAADIAEAVDAAFQPPYMAFKENEIVCGYKDQKRTVILVGIDLHNDLKVLKKHNSEVFTELDTLDSSSSVIREVVDVAQLYCVEHGIRDKPGLATMLRSLNLPTSDLHNAGNDANCALRVLVRLMLQVAGEKLDVEPKDKDESATPKDVDANQAK